MHKADGWGFVHSTRGVLTIVLVATLALGMFCLVGSHAIRTLDMAGAPATAAPGNAALAAVEERATPEGTRVPVISALASMLVASDPSDSSGSGAVAHTSWRALAVEVCRELLAAGIL